jgi:hypothetical protein
MSILDFVIWTGIGFVGLGVFIAVLVGCTMLLDWAGQYFHMSADELFGYIILTIVGVGISALFGVMLQKVWLMIGGF